jgi:hypothetical protein
MRPSHLLTLGVALAALLAHLPSASGEFVYDDQRFIVENRALVERSWTELAFDPATASAGTGLGGAGEGIVADIYRPLRTLLFAAERAVFGLRPGWWHALSLALHALNAVLVLRLLRGLGVSHGFAALGALVFAVHPVGVESVGWISSQGDLLALTLMLVALIVLERPGHGRTVLGMALALLACLAKESALVLPALLWLRDRARPADVALPARTTWGRSAALVLVVAGYLVLRANLLPGELAQVRGPDAALAERARGFLAALGWYVLALVWPSGFRFETDLPIPLAWGEPLVVFGGGVLLTLLMVGVVAWRRGRPALALFCAWGALAALVPVSQVLVPLKTLAAERFLYPVLPCVAAAVAGATVVLVRRWGRGWALLPLLLALPLALRTWERSTAWRDEVALWEAVRIDRPSNARAYEGLGYALLARGRYQDGERAYSSYLEFNPFDGKARRRMADYLGSLAQTLVSHDPRVEAGSELRQRRNQVRAMQVAMLESALGAWELVGYESGRGSEAWVVDTRKKLRDAAIQLGDLARAKAANDALIARSGVDPRDPAAVAARAGLDERTCRWFLAWMAVTAPEGELGEEARRDRWAQRTAVVSDMGLFAQRPDATLVGDLEAPLKRLRAEQEQKAAQEAVPAEAARAWRRADELAYLHAELLAATGRGAEAQRLREATAMRALQSPAGRPR